jgi:hypothetical protein
MRIFSAFLLAGCAIGAAREGDPLRERIERFAEDRGALLRTYPVPMSPGRLERLRRFYEETPVPADDASVDARLLETHLRHQLQLLDLEAKRDAELAGLIPFAAVVVGLEEARRRFEPADPAAAAAKLDRLAKDLAELRKKEPKAERPVARRAAQRVGGLRDALRTWHRFHAGYHPEFTWWVQKPWEKADQELGSYQAHLRDKVAKENEPGAAGLVGDPIGREALLADLAAEWIAHSPEELVEAAEKEFAWCEERLREAAREMGVEDPKAALEKVKSAHAPPGKQPELVRDYARLAIEFVERRGLVTVPELCKEAWRMEMMTPERQRTTPYFTGGELVSVSFPTADMDHEQKLQSLRGNNLHFAWATVHHEVIPGHHLQLFMSQRHAVHRRLFRTPFLVEGWALWWELLLWDLGFARSPGDKVGMLFWRKHRAARILVSLRFHLGRMKPAEMVDFLVDRVGHERDGATAEVRRYLGGDYPPLYQAAYLVGGWQLRALHRELVGSGRMTDRAFHDAVLRENAIPIELIRASLTGAKLPRGAAPSWRFLD